MSINNEQMVNMVNNHHHEEVDYADPESPTLAVRQSASPTTGPVEHLTDVIETDNNADTADMLLPGGEPTLATSTGEAPTTSYRPQPRNEGAGYLLTLMRWYTRYNTSP